MEESLRRLDLDDSFGFVFGNSVCESITPYRLALYLLIRTIDSEHREHPLTQKQLVELSSIVYGLISAVNLSFAELCRAAEKPFERTAPSLFAKFLKRVDSHRGQMEVMIRREDLLQVHSRRDRLDKAHHLLTPKSLLGVFLRKLAVSRARQSLTECERTHAQWLQWLGDDRPSARGDLFGPYGCRLHAHSKPTSFDATDATRLAPLVENTHLSSSAAKDRAAHMNEPQLVSSISPSSSAVERSEIAEGGGVRDVFRCPKPAEGSTASGSVAQSGRCQPPLALLLSSNRARALITRQLHLLQVSPDEALGAEELKSVCSFIKSSYSNLALVYLVEMLNAIRMRNENEAENSLRLFFDWTTIRVNDSNALGGAPLTTVDQRPLRYAPLLHARLARIFNQREHALQLLSEAIQQAHSNRDILCLRLALVEQAAVEALPRTWPPPPPIASSSSVNTPVASAAPVASARENIAPLCSSSPALLLSMWASESSSEEESDGAGGGDGDEPRMDGADLRAFVRQLRDCATLQSCIDSAISCKNTQNLTSGLQACAGANYGVDRETQSRAVSDAAKAVASSVKLVNGFVSAAVSDAHMLLHCNPGDHWALRYDTEAHVIAAVNVVYSHALNGRFAAAVSLIEELKKRFTIKNNFQCAQHWMRCEALIQFDRSFFFGDWTSAENWLSTMVTFAPEEADLRRAVLEYSKGDLREAIEVARSRVEKSKKSKDLRLKLRSELVLAMLYASNRMERVARASLTECLETAKSHSIELFAAIITRRLAYIDAKEGRHEDSLRRIAECEWTIRTRCSRLENALLHMTVYVAHSKPATDNAPPAQGGGGSGKECDSKALCALAAARNEFRRASAPLLEKGVLAAAAILYNADGKFEERDECAIAFRDIDEKYPGSIDWTVL